MTAAYRRIARIIGHDDGSEITGCEFDTDGSITVRGAIRNATILPAEYERIDRICDLCRASFLPWMVTDVTWVRHVPREHKDKELCVQCFVVFVNGGEEAT